MMVPVGYENFANHGEFVAIVRVDSAPARKLRQNAESERMLINATGGRKARSIIITKSNHVILSALQTTTLKERVAGQMRKGLV